VLALSVFLAVLGPLALAAGPARAQAGFTATERDALERGRLVVRSEERAIGEYRLVGGTSWQVIDLPPEDVWRSVHDAQMYQHVLPRAETVEVLASTPVETRVRVRHAAGPIAAEYTLVMQFDERERYMRFHLDRGADNDLREGWGYVHVREYAPGRSIVVYGVLADLGSGVIAGFVRAEVQEWMLKVPRELRRWVEGPGRPRRLG
jgi:hypothetical protein